MDNPFVNTLTQFSSLSEDGQLALAKASVRLEHEKGHILIRQDSVSEYIYFIERGLTRTYYYKDGKDITDWLSAEGQFAGSIASFITRQPDRRIVQLLEPSVLWAISFSALEQLYRSYHEIERLGRLLVSHGLVLLQKRFDDLHFATALERYQQFMASTPALLQRVPLGMIASYLGVTQETLSRIRAQV
ncbi:Crp/Fnr family transcriptional regulator [Spirosoma endbachense]|uniref:Cyclic nucleotide-binding domain-containing protein n=1 Tax=Spirosoma endbachense TaxID=2666025 RepID=A0A6P1VRJ9_9BACT|nr:Crp/Fnr family transcriptional regulator [Spirosoma endbachense]QHV93986.1 cyclic nucleotide-binding domain-containing protein [Spirosoma endbachense]